MLPPPPETEQEILPPESSLPDTVQVTAAVHPLRVQRDILKVAVGQNIYDIVHKAAPDYFIDRVLVTVNGEIVERKDWAITRVKPYDVVVLRALPQGGQNGIKMLERLILTIAVIAITFAVLGPVGGFAAMGFEAGSTGAFVIYASIVATVNAVAALAINALIPPVSGKSGNAPNSTQTFGISGVQNSELPYGVVPRIYGRTLMTPPKGAHSYTVAGGHDTYLYALFDLGPGPIAISDIKIGQTPIDDFAGVQYETREGRDTDDDITIYTNAVKQTPLSIGMLHQYDTATQRTPINTTHMEIDITNPGGLVAVDTKGNTSSFTQNFQVVVKKLDGTVVQSHTVSMTDATPSAVSQSFTLDDQPAGQYDITVERLTAPPDPQRGTAAAYWTAIRTWGPSDGPLLPKNHAKIAVSIKATEQLNGDIANLNCIAQSYVQVYDPEAETFSEELNTHPAWAALSVLTGSSVARPLNTSRVDLESLAEWAATYPTAEFNFVFSQRTTVWQALRTIGSAGRGIPVIRDGLYGFVFDRVQDSPVQLFTTRNVAGFKATKSFFDEIHGMEIRYVSETMGWQQHSVYVYASGYTADNADATKISPLELPGVTSDDWAYKLGSYFFAASLLRPVVYSFETDLDHLACQPGDRVLVQHDVVSSGVVAGRIKSLIRDGSSHITSIVIDEPVTGDGTSTYSMVVRSQQNHLWTVPITVASGIASTTFSTVSPFDDQGTFDPIQVGDLVAIQIMGTELLDAVVKVVTPKPDFKATVTLLDYAPEVHTGDSAIVPTVVNDRIDKFVHALPTASVVIDSLIADESTALSSSGGTLTPQIHGHFYILQDGQAPGQFDVQWKLDGSIGYTDIPSLPASAREFFIPISYNSLGKTYDVRMRANNSNGTDPGQWATASLLIADYSVVPAEPVLTITPTIKGVTASITAADYDTAVAYRLYASTSESFSTAELIASGPSSPLQATGLDSTTVYFFWATTVNGAGVESTESADVSAIPLPIGYTDLGPDVQDFTGFLADNNRELRDAVSEIATAVTSLGMGTYSDVTTLRASISSTAAGLTADYTSLITAATGPGSALVLSTTTLTAALSGYLGAGAVASAVTTLQTQVTANSSSITSQAASITTINSALSGYLGSSAVSNAVNSLQTQVTTNAGNISTAAANITTINSALSGYLGGSAVSTAVNSLQTQITTNGTNISTSAANITSLQSALSGYTGANAVSNAVSSLTTSISTTNGNVSALSSSLTSVSSTVGNFSASGKFRVNTRSSLYGGSDATIAIEVAASSGGSSYGSAIYLDAMSGGASRVTIIAGEFFVTDGTNTHAPFFFSGGTAYLDNAVVQNLDASTITTGTLNVGTLIASGSIVTNHLENNAVTKQFAYTSGSSGVVSNGATVILGTDDLSTSYSGYTAIIQYVGSITRQGGHSPVMTAQIFRGDSGGGSQTAAGIGYQSGGSGIPLVNGMVAMAIDTVPASNGYYGVKINTDDGSTLTSNEGGLIVTVFKK